MNPFNVLYQSRVKVLEITESGAYEKKRSERELCEIAVDVQPYSGSLAAEKYGYKKECQLRMFCAYNPEIKPGRYIKYNGKIYQIQHIAEWEFGEEVLLNGVDNINRGN